jgi:hypothetical protein
MQFNLQAANAWKGNIPQAKISLNETRARSLDHVTSLNPARNGSRVNDEIVWEFKDFAPAEDDNIQIEFNRRRTWQALVSEARKEKERFWDSRTFLVRQLANSAAREGRAEMTEKELTDYLNELEGLLSELEVKGDRAVMPETTALKVHGDVDGMDDIPPEIREEMFRDEPRNYAHRHGGRHLLRYFNNALEAAEQYGTPQAKKVLERWLVAVDWFLKDALYAGDARITVAPNSAEAYKEELQEKVRQARKLLD